MLSKNVYNVKTFCFYLTPVYIFMPLILLNNITERTKISTPFYMIKFYVLSFLTKSILHNKAKTPHKGEFLKAYFWPSSAGLSSAGASSAGLLPVGPSSTLGLSSSVDSGAEPEDGPLFTLG